MVRLRSKLAERGLVLVPLKLYFKGHIVKVSLGLGKGKNTHDKRQTLKERDIKRDTDREMKEYR